MDEMAKSKTCLKADPIGEKRNRVACIDVAKLSEIAASSMAKIAQYAQLGKDALESFEPEEVLVINIPNDVKSEIEKGAAWLNKRKDGSGILPQVMVEAENGRKQVKKMLTAEARPLASDDLRRALTQDLNNIYLQQQLPMIAAQLEETLDCVYRIKQGQQDDRFGAVFGAVNQIRYALDTGDKAALKNAIGALQSSVGVLGESLKTLVSSFEKVPDSKLGLAAKMLFGVDYSGKKRSELEEISEYFDLYEKAQEALVVGAYLANGEIGMRSILAQRRSFLESLDVTKLQTLKHLLPASALECRWVSELEAYIDEREAEYRLLPEGSYGSIEVKVAVGQLMRALEDDGANKNE